MLHDREIAEEVAHSCEETDPQRRSAYVVRRELGVLHARHARHEGREGANNGHEARQHDGLAAVLGIKVLSFVEHALLDHPLSKHPLTRGLPDGVVERVPHHRRSEEQPHHQRQVERAERGERAASEQQAVTRKEGRHHQTCLTEDDAEQDGVRRSAVLRDDGRHRLVEVQHETDGRREGRAATVGGERGRRRQRGGCRAHQRPKQ
mmetsp:Transcript_10058/g.41722  ORF Transcript_10058/g.41722 Transcript_10058/m.41722 type:complete len:206 (-) Transcript_10058:8-625(-)